MESCSVNAGLTPSTAKLKRMLGPSPAPRVLTRYEIELLRESTREVVQVVGEVLANRASTWRNSKRN